MNRLWHVCQKTGSPFSLLFRPENSVEAAVFLHLIAIVFTYFPKWLPDFTECILSESLTHQAGDKLNPEASNESLQLLWN